MSRRRNREQLAVGAVAVFAMVTAVAAEPPIPNRQPEDDRRLQVVQVFAENVLEQGRDRWSGRDTPLLADGVHVDTGEPVVWRHEQQPYIIHNLASQQNLFRVFTGLSNLTSEKCYKQAAADAIRYHFDHLVSPCGKLRWGGHQFIDLRTLEPVGHFDADCHEFKRNFPFYELMWEVDRNATARFIRALWSGHVSDWRVLELNRHAPYGDDPPGGVVWDQPFDAPPPFFESSGLSFLNCGSDLVYAGAMLAHMKDDPRPLDWAMRLVGMYTKARHPRTGMGAYQYTRPRRRRTPPDDGPLTGTLTYSSYGDRLENQYANSGSPDPDAPQYNPVRGKLADDGVPVAREGWAWRFSAGAPWYANVQLYLAELLGDSAAELARDAADHLEAHARYAYDAESNHFRPMWADGTDLSGLTIPRTGYHGHEGIPYLPRGATLEHLVAYARAYRVTGRPALWTTARDIARGWGMGDIGAAPGEGIDLNTDASIAEPEAVFAILELHRAAPHPAYIEMARRITNRMVESRFHNGFFLPGADHVHANFDAIEPLAVLSLEAVLRGQPELVPVHVGGRGYIHGHFDGLGRTYDFHAIWSRTRADTSNVAGKEPSCDEES